MLINSFATLRTINGKHFLVPVVGQVANDAHVFELNGMGAFIWSHLIQGRTIKRIANEIVQRYKEIEIQEAEKEVQKFVDMLKNVGLIKVAGEPAKKDSIANYLSTADMDAFAKECISERIPLQGNLEITYKCNLKCRHCYARYGNGESPIGDELTSGEICNIIDQLVDEGFLYLTLTGGELLIRPDFYSVYEYAKNKGVLITLLTNGTLINAETLDLFSRLPPFDVEISLYGATQKTYESITRVRGSFNCCIKGIRNLLDIGVPVCLKTIVMNLNVHELVQMKEFAAQLGVPFRWSGLIYPRLNGDKTPWSLRLPPDKLAALELGDKNRKKAWQALLDKGKGGKKYLYPCNAGLTTFQISPFGKLSACAIARHPSYDLRKGSFREGWYKFLYENIRLRELDVPSECSDCDIQAICNECPGWEQLSNGLEGKKVDYLCQLAHARAKGLHRY